MRTEPAHDHESPRPDPAAMSAEQLVVLLAHAIRKQRLKALEPFGLALHQARAFAIIGRESARGGQELRLTGLAHRLRIAPRSATEVVDALEQKGLVLRSPSPTDRRATVLSLTDAGHRILAALREKEAAGHPGADPTHDWESTPTGIFAGLDTGQLRTLTDLLRQVVRSLP